MNSRDGVYAHVSRHWDPLTCAEITEEIFTHHETTGSTNDDVLELPRASGWIGGVAVADYQLRGRGRRGDRWEATAGRSLLFSVLVDLPREGAAWHRLPQMVAWWMGRTIEEVTGPELRIQSKWPNDLYCGNAKLGGILVETRTHPWPRAALGVGVNVNTREKEFPDGLDATSLFIRTRRETCRWVLLGRFLEKVAREYPQQNLYWESVLAWHRERDFLAGRLVEVRTGRTIVTGRARGVGDEGELAVETAPGKRETVSSCEELRDASE